MPFSASCLPPVSSLFPYTTLFRSLILMAGADFETRPGYSVLVRTTDSGGLVFDKQFTITVTDANDPPADIGLSAASIGENNEIKTTDRKSTRLNSSHRCISYAVFCVLPPACLFSLSLHDALPIFDSYGGRGLRDPARLQCACTNH